MIKNKQVKMKLREEYNWLEEATNKELQDEFDDLSFELDSIGLDLFSTRYNDCGWRARAQRAALYKRGGRELIKLEIEKRSKAGPTKATKSGVYEKRLKEQLVVLKGKNRKMKTHYDAIITQLNKNLTYTKESHLENNNRQRRLINLMRDDIGFDRFIELVSIVDEV